MTPVDPENFFAVIAWLGGACFCGLVPLVFAVILFFSARKRGRTGSQVAAAQPSATGVLPGAGLVRLGGKVVSHDLPLFGSPEKGLVYLRLKVEFYDTDQERPEWRGVLDEAHGIPFQLDDGSGPAWVNPKGLDKHLLGKPFVPDDDQLQSAFILLNIDPEKLPEGVRFWMWELRVGQTLTVVGPVGQAADGGRMVQKVEGQTLVVSPLLGEAVGATVASQTKKSSVLMWVLGIPGVLFLLCGLGGALVALIRMLQ